MSGVVGLLDAQRDVVLQLALEALADLAAGDELAFAAGERRVVHLEVHRSASARRRCIGGSASGVSGSRRRVVPMLEVLDAGDSTMSPAPRLVDRHALQALEAAAPG